MREQVSGKGRQRQGLRGYCEAETKVKNHEERERESTWLNPPCNFLSLLLFQRDSVSPGWPPNIRIGAIGPAKAIMAAGWAPDGQFSACPRAV